MQGHFNLVSFTLSGYEIFEDARPILIDAANPKRFLTKSQARSLVTRLAGAFRHGSTVCLHLHNDILYPILVLAILASGCRWTGTMPVYTISELEHHFRSAEVNCIITSLDMLQAVEAGLKGSGRLAEIIVFEDIVELGKAEWEGVMSERSQTENGGKRLGSLLRNQTQVDLHIYLKIIQPEDPATLMQTSGTTGLPKMAMRTHASHMAELGVTEDYYADESYPIQRLFCTPIIHAFPFPQAIFNSIRLGLPSIIMKRFDDTIAQTIHDHHITEIFVAPVILLRLANSPQSHPVVQSVRCIYYAGCLLTQSLRNKTLGIFAEPPRMVPVYGMTEGGWFTTFDYPEEDRTEAVGRPVPVYKLKVSKSTETTVDVDGIRVGELLAFGPQMSEGYLNDEESTKDAFTSDGWLRTGDIGYINEDGEVYLIDRAEDLIKVNGFQVAPAELESVLARSTDVLDAAVFGVGADIEEHPLAQRNALFEVAAMGRSEQVSVLEAASKLGTKWPRIIPFNSLLRLLDSEVSAALHLKTLAPERHSHCQHCGSPSSFNHSEICKERHPWTLWRHGAVKNVIGHGQPGGYNPKSGATNP